MVARFSVPLAGVVPDQWRAAVVDDKGRVERIPYELCVLVALRDAVRRREIWVVGANRWRNPEDDLPADFEDNRDVHYAALGQPQDARLIIVAHTQLRLTREAAADLRRPWEKPAEPARLTPARVRRGFRNLRPHLHCPASAPKPSTPGPGRPLGSKNRRPTTHYDVGKTTRRPESIIERDSLRG